MWPLTLVGMLGVVTCATFTYSSGVFLQAMTHEFGWTRAQFASAFTMQMLIGLVAGPLVGRAIDRMGPRPLAIGGLFTFVIGFSLLGLANGSIWQWRLLCVVAGLGVAAITPPTWVTAVAGRFDASRGLAIATVLAGTGIATAMWPWVAARLIGGIGWRLAFPAMAAGAFVVMLPLTFAFFHAAPRVRDQAGRVAVSSLWPALRSRAFVCLLIAGCLYASVTIGLTLHLVPILTGNGLSLENAAGAAVIVGAAMLVGRIVTGVALDRLPTRIVGLVAFLLPIAEAACLWQGKGSPALSLVGAALLGLSSGAESDVLVYLVSRRFGRSVFASVYAIFGAFFSIAASIGPLIAGAFFDRDGSYDGYFLLCVPIALVAALLISLVPSAPTINAPDRPGDPA